MDKKCQECGKEITVQEEIYYDIPSGSKSYKCQECYDKYMILLVNGVTE